MEIRYNVKDEEELARIKHLVNYNIGDENGPTFLSILNGSGALDDVEIHMMNNVVVIGGAYKMKTGLQINSLPLAPVTGFQVQPGRVSFFVGVPSSIATQVELVAYDMECIE